MENKKRITEEDLFKDLDLNMADLFTVNDVFKELTSTRYGFYHVATILCAGIHGLLTTSYIIKELEAFTLDSYRNMKYHFEDDDGNFGAAMAVNAKTGEEVDFALGFLNVDDYDIKEFLLKEDLEEYLERKESTGCSLGEAIGTDVLLINIRFAHKRIVAMFDSRNERLILLGEKENHELDMLNPKDEHKLYYAIMSSILSIFVYMDMEDSKYRVYDKDSAFKRLDELITTCDDDEVKALFGKFFLEEVTRKDSASNYAQVLMALREAAMEGSNTPEFPDPADKDKLN